MISLISLIELSYDPRAYLWLRAMRCVLRPLKCINVLPGRQPFLANLIGVKTLLESLISALREFVNVAIFMIFVFILFATMGL